MSTQQNDDATDLIRNRTAIGVRLPKESYEKIKALSRREHRGIGAQCAVFIERQLALEEAANESQAQKKPD
jgi:predicted DNA-binding protein